MTGVNKTKKSRVAMQNQGNKSNDRLVVGVLIGSVAGMAVGAVATNIMVHLVGKVWTKLTQGSQPNRVDPRWLLQ
jgi:hypothetical protein